MRFSKGHRVALLLVASLFAERTLAAKGPNYVICSGNFRACSTWQYNVVSHLVEEYQDGVALGYVNGDALPPGPGSCTKVLKCHDRYPHFERLLCEGHAVGIYSYRNLVEAFESLAHQGSTTVIELYRTGFLDRILRNHEFWMEQPNVLVQRYEEVTRNPRKSVSEIAAFLNLKLSRTKIAEIVTEFSLRRNIARNARLREQLIAQGKGLNDPANVDPTTLFYWNHIRTPEQKKPRGWRALPTPEAAHIRALVDDWNEANGYPLSFEEKSEK